MVSDPGRRPELRGPCKGITCWERRTLHVLDKKTPAHHVLRLNLHILLDPLAPTRRPSGHHPRHPRLGLGPPRVSRPFFASDRAYGPRLGQGSPTQAARPAPDLARRSP